MSPKPEARRPGGGRWWDGPDMTWPGAGPVRAARQLARVAALAAVFAVCATDADAQRIRDDPPPPNDGLRCAYRDTPIQYAAARPQILIALLCVTNNERVKAGLTPVSSDALLSQAAQLHTEDMVARHYFEHVNKRGCDPTCRAAKVGYVGGVAENIASGYTTIYTPRTVVQAWMGSTGHRANLLNPDHTVLGVGGTSGPDGRFDWTQDFGSAAPAPGAVTGLEPEFQGAADPARTARERDWQNVYGPRVISHMSIKDRISQIWVRVAYRAPSQPFARIVKLWYPVTITVRQGTRRSVTRHEVGIVYDRGYLSEFVKLPRPRRAAVVTVSMPSVTKSMRFTPYAKRWPLRAPTAAQAR